MKNILIIAEELIEQMADGCIDWDSAVYQMVQEGYSVQLAEQALTMAAEFA